MLKMRMGDRRKNLRGERAANSFRFFFDKVLKFGGGKPLELGDFPFFSKNISLYVGLGILD